MKDFDPMKLLYPAPKTDALILKLAAEDRLTRPLSRALGKLSAEMLFLGKSDEDVVAAIEDCFK